MTSKVDTATPDRYDDADEIDRLRAENARLNAELERVRPVADAAIAMTIASHAVVKLGVHLSPPLDDDERNVLAYSIILLDGACEMAMGEVLRRTQALRKGGGLMTCPNCTHATELQHVCEHCDHRADASHLADATTVTLPLEHFQQREACSRCGDPVDKEPGGLCVDCAYVANYGAQCNWKLCQDLRAQLAALARAAIQFADDATNPLFGQEAREKRGARLREMAEKVVNNGE